MFFFLIMRRPPRSTQSRSSAASDVYKRQAQEDLRRWVREALDMGKGTVKIDSGDGRDRSFSTRQACPSCGKGFPDLDPRLFSYNSRQGWCPSCFGTGLRLDGFDAEQSGEEIWWNSWYEGEEVPCPVCRGKRLRPEALAVTPNGRIAVLDSVNKRLLFLDATGRPSGTAEIALAEPRFLAVDNDRLYVLDCDADRKVLVLDWAGAVRETLPLPELPDVVTALFAAEVGPCVEVAHDSVFLLTKDAGAAGAAPNRSSLRSVAGRPLDRTLTRAAKVTFAPTKGLHMKTFKVERGSLKATKLAEASPGRPSTHKVEHLVSVDGDGAGGVIVGARVTDAVDSGFGQSMRNKPAAVSYTHLTLPTIYSV